MAYMRAILHFQWIGLREKLQEIFDFTIKIH